MSTEQTKKEDKRTATQRLEDLQNAVMSLYQVADNMARDVQVVKDAMKLLGNKVDSMVKASTRGLALSDETISKIMVENNVDELKQKVQNLVDQGVLVAEDKATATSFVVGRELDDKGEVANPRIQFALASIKEDIRNKIVGAGKGDVVTLEEGKLKFELTETFGIKDPNAEAAPAATEAAAQETAAIPDATAPAATTDDSTTAASGDGSTPAATA